MCITNNPSIGNNNYVVTSHMQNRVDPVLQRTAENTYSIGLSAITIAGLTLAVGAATNFVGAILYAAPLAALWLCINGLEHRIDQIEDLYLKQIAEIKTGLSSQRVPSIPSAPPAAYAPPNVPSDEFMG